MGSVAGRRLHGWATPSTSSAAGASSGARSDCPARPVAAPAPGGDPERGAVDRVWWYAPHQVRPGAAAAVGETGSARRGGQPILLVRANKKGVVRLANRPGPAEYSVLRTCVATLARRRLFIG